MNPEIPMDEERNARARAAAQRAIEGRQAPATGTVEYRSRGRILLIGGEEALRFAPRLLPRLHPQVLVTDGSDEPSVPAIPLGGRPVRLGGHLGAFRLEIGEPGARDHEVIAADLVLDLSARPLIGAALKPPGYIHSDGDPLLLDALTKELPEMVGTFEKPRYFDYDPDRCAHGRSGQRGCSRCIEACPAEAIGSLAERIEVDPWRCQGGGVCATVCPSGAIGYAYPPAAELQERLRTLLRTYREAGGRTPVVAFVTGQAPPVADAGHLLWVAVEELASVGLEVWLGALAHGAHGVLLVGDGELPAGVAAALKSQLETARALLEALGYPGDAVRLVDAGGLEPGLPAGMPEIPPATFAPVGSKRERAFAAIDHLYAQAPRPLPLVGLPAGAPFGEAGIDPRRCTLCLACTGACPAGALQAAGGGPGVRFIEANCLQCGLCTRTCPEDAIWIAPRLLLDREARGRPRVLHAEPPFECVVCGTAFATRRVIDTLFSRLQGHAMFQGPRARRRLMMCQACRVADLVDDPEIQAAGFLGGDDHAR